MQFQSTPDLVNRENVDQVSHAIAFALFQSTPDLVNRENSSSTPDPELMICFNPLPI